MGAANRPRLLFNPTSNNNPTSNKRMKLVALKSFSNVKRLGLDPKEIKLQHDGHVHKGLRFTVGKSEVFKELDENQKGIVSELVAAGAAVVDCKDNEDIIKRIDDEVKTDEAVAKKLAAKTTPAPPAP
jgi:hypothetical protein